MRITFGMLSRSALENLMSGAERLADAQRRASTGKRISKPSDDVTGTGRALDLRSTISQVEQYVRNCDAAKAQLEVTSSALDSAVSALQRVRSIAVEAGSTSTTYQARAALASELDQIMTSLAASGNTIYADKYIFGGSKTKEQPIVTSGLATPPYQYQGNDTLISLQIAPWTSRTSWFVYVVTLDQGVDGAAVIAGMERRGIPARVYFVPMHTQPYLKDLPGAAGRDLPVTESVAGRTVALPFHNNLSRQDIEWVASALEESLAEVAG
jgi:flagellin-like hook-associated protein FlgL